MLFASTFATRVSSRLGRRCAFPAKPAATVKRPIRRKVVCASSHYHSEIRLSGSVIRPSNVKPCLLLEGTRCAMSFFQPPSGASEFDIRPSLVHPPKPEGRISQNKMTDQSNNTLV